SEKNRTPNRNVWVSADHSAMLSVEALPTDQVIKPELAPKMILLMKQNRAKSGDKPTQDPAVEKDDRWVIRIRERFTAKDGKPGEQLHLYRAVGARFLLVTCKTFGGDKMKDQFAAAEAASLSAAYVKPTKK
ncbi:MAG: hypothetical protein JWO31_4093, partial [Phycisphaerales bacterium]|nr:hypothetical protein [Phycisphaerales bacterium]